jgi:hypothetical protein
MRKMGTDPIFLIFFPVFTEWQPASIWARS